MASKQSAKGVTIAVGYTIAGSWGKTTCTPMRPHHRFATEAAANRFVHLAFLRVAIGYDDTLAPDQRAQKLRELSAEQTALLATRLQDGE